MANGKVKWFNLKKGYGFIQPEEGDKDIFVHISALQNSGIRNLFEEQNVEYDVAEEKGKVSAVNIKLPLRTPIKIGFFPINFFDIDSPIFLIF